MCSNHGEEMFNAWKLGKPWGELDNSIKISLQKTIKTNEIKSILKRSRFALLNSDIISDPTQFKNMIEEGDIELDKSLDRGTYGIRVTQDFSPKVLGASYLKKEGTGELEETPSTKLYIAFDVGDVIKTMLAKDGQWDSETEGRITTICID